MLAQLERLAIRHAQVKVGGPQHVAPIRQPLDEAELLQRFEHAQQRAHVQPGGFAHLRQHQPIGGVAEGEQDGQGAIDCGDAALCLHVHVDLVTCRPTRWWRRKKMKVVFIIFVTTSLAIAVWIFPGDAPVRVCK